MKKAFVCSLALGAAVAVAVAVPSGFAAADVVTPPGACTATGHWVHQNVTRSSRRYARGDVVLVPQRDTVMWEGHEQGKAVGSAGPARPIDGAVAVQVPFGITVTLWHWSAARSSRYANQGVEGYDLPSALVGVELKLSGYEKDSGTTVCSGSVYVEVTGNRAENPAGWAAIALGALSLAGMLAAGFRKRRPAYVDLGPGAGAP